MHYGRETSSHRFWNFKHDLVALGFLTRIRKVNTLCLYVDAETLELHYKMAISGGCGGCNNKPPLCAQQLLGGALSHHSYHSGEPGQHSSLYPLRK